MLNIRTISAELKALRRNFTLFWVKDHLGIFSNERVDALARAAAVSQDISDNTVFPIDIGVGIRTHFLREK